MFGARNLAPVGYVVFAITGGAVVKGLTVSDAWVTDTGSATGASNVAWTSAAHLLFRVVRAGDSWWRCRESNPGPSSSYQGFSERSSLCLCSAPPITRASRCDGPSR